MRASRRNRTTICEGEGSRLDTKACPHCGGSCTKVQPVNVIFLAGILGFWVYAVYGLISLIA